MWPREPGLSAEVAAGDAGGAGGDGGGGAGGDEGAAGGSAAGAHVEDPVGGADEVEVVLDDDDGGAVGDQPTEDVQQGPHVEGVEADGRFVEEEKVTI